MRERLAQLLSDTANADPTFYVLSGDHGYALFDALRRSHPSQFINVGVSEQAMVGISAGLAKSGLRPVVYGLAAFIPLRVLEFIKIDVCYEALPVIFLGDGAGLVYSTLGASHQCGEDMAALQALPNLRIYSPADALELEWCFAKSLADKSAASYIRLGKSDRPRVHSKDLRLADQIGYAEVYHSLGEKVIIATGSMVSTAMELGREFSFSVYSVYGISDFSAEDVEHIVEERELVITLEEHSVWGGLGAIVDRHLLDKNLPKKTYHFGMKRRFTHLASSYEIALHEHELTVEQLRAAIRRIP